MGARLETSCEAPLGEPKVIQGNLAHAFGGWPKTAILCFCTWAGVTCEGMESVKRHEGEDDDD